MVYIFVLPIMYAYIIYTIYVFNVISRLSHLRPRVTIKKAVQRYTELNHNEILKTGQVTQREVGKVNREMKNRTSRKQQIKWLA